MEKEHVADLKTEIAELRQKSIQEVAEALGLAFNGNEWIEHDSFKLDLKKNRASWYSRGEEFRNMDVFQLVMRMRDVSFKEAYQFVKTGEFKEVEIKTEAKQPFVYYLEKFEDDSFSKARAYLKNERQLSDETIDFFIDQGVLAQATRRTNIEMSTVLSGKYYYDPVIVFKTLDRYNKVIGTSMIGIDDNQSIYELEDKAIKRKQIAYNSDGLGGVNISIGKPNRIVVVEAPIDLMSYYELHKSDLSDVLLVALDGSSTKLSSVKRYVMDIMTDKEWSLNPDRSKLNEQFKMTLENTDVLKQQPNLITVAVDNDEAGLRMIKDFQKQNIPVVADLPPLHDGQTKNDWNGELQYVKGGKVVTTTQKDKKTMTKAHKINEPTWGDIYDRAPDWLEYAYEMSDISDGYPAKTKASDWYVFSDDFDLKPDSILTDAQKIEIQTQRSFYDDDGKFHSFKEALEASGASIPENMPEMYDDRPTLEEEAEWLMSQGRVEEGQWLLNNQLKENEEKQMIKSPGQASLFENLATVTPGAEKLNNKKALERTQELSAETTFGDFPDKQEAAPLPVAEQPLNEQSPAQTQSQPLLNITITNPEKSIYVRNYHPIRSDELRKLNRYTLQLQQSAQYYLNHLSDSKISYFYKEQDELKVLQVNFLKKNFMHLTGIRPLAQNQTAEKTLIDFAQGNGEFENVLIANRGATFSKLQVLPELPGITDSKAFVFDDLSDVAFAHSLNVDKAIRAVDKDVVLAFRTADDDVYPASLLKATNKINFELDKNAQDKTILGVFRDCDGIIDTLSINDEYIKDNGQALKLILENHEVEEITNEFGKNDAILNADRDDEKIPEYSKAMQATFKDLERGQEENMTFENNQNFRDIVAHYLEETTGRAFEDDEHKDLGKFIDERFNLLQGNNLIDRDSYQSEVVTVLTQYFNHTLSQAEVEKLIDGYVKDSNEAQQRRFDEEEKALSDSEEMAIQIAEDLDIANFLQQDTLMNFDLQAVEFSDVYKDNEKVPQAQDLTLALEDSESFEWGDDSRLFVRAELLDYNTGETVIHTPFIVDKPTETDFGTWWQDNYKVIDKQIRSSDDVVALEKELDFRRLPKLEQEKILDEQNGVTSLFDDENNSNEVDQTVAEENIQTDKTEGESYRLTQARQKLERLENEFSAAVQDVFDHQKTTNGQPMNDKRTGGAWFRRQNQKEDKAGDLQAEIKKQRERIEALEWREENAKLGLSASGGLVKSVENIELWQQRVERLEFVRDYNKSHGLPLGTPFDNGTRLEFYDSKKLKDAKETVKKLSEIKAKSDQATKAITPEAQALIDSGEVSQWKKKPTLYFVKGLRKVALELNENGEFQTSSRYPATTEEAKSVVETLLETYNIGRQGQNKSQGDQDRINNVHPAPLQEGQYIFRTLKAMDHSVDEIGRVLKIDGQGTRLEWISRVDGQGDWMKHRESGRSAFPAETFEKGWYLGGKEQENIFDKFFYDEGVKDFNYGDMYLNDNNPQLSDVEKEFLGLSEQETLQDKASEMTPTQSSETLAVTEVKLEPNQDIIDAARAKDIKALSAHLKEGIKQYLNSDQYKQFLNAMSKFHRYSPGNIQLILAQKPDAKLIAPAGRWKSEFERFPAKGSKAIYIWDYREKLAKDEQGKVILDEKGKPKKEHYFVLAPKFDVSQTVGKEMPKAVNELEDNQELNQTQVANLYRALKMTSLENGVPVSFENITNGANGYYDPANHSITLGNGMSQTQTLKTLIHEMAHSDLHNSTQREKVSYTYSNQELQAESVAYVVASHYGIDTSSYSFGYLASWSDDKVGLSDLEAQLKIVQQEAKSLITRIDTSMEKLIAVQNKQVPKNPFEEKLTQEKERTKQEQTVAKEQTIKKDQGVHL